MNWVLEFSLMIFGSLAAGIVFIWIVDHVWPS